jgi:hypothetical protein
MKSIIPILESVKDLAPKSDEERMGLAYLLHQVEDGNEKSNEKLVSLLTEIKKYPELSIFDNFMEVAGSGAIRIIYSDLMGWLIERAASKSPEEAVKNLEKYVSTEEIPLSEVIAISGLKLKESCELANGIRLIPWELFPECSQKDYINNEFIRRSPVYIPSAVVLKEKPIKRSHIHVPQGETKKYFDTNVFNELDDALLCISLVGPVSTFAIVKWLQPPEWAPLRGSGYHIPFYEGRPISKDWPADGCEQAQRLYKAFLDLTDDERSVLIIPLKRLNVAMRKWSLVDSAIDLGIALESIFLNELEDDRGELTFRLRLRASRFLGSDLASRKNLFKIFGNLYSLRSRAVHSGKLPDKLKKQPVSEILNQGFNLTAEAITKIILNGLPDWDKVTFS